VLFNLDDRKTPLEAILEGSGEGLD
jgi:hypothetical protein